MAVPLQMNQWVQVYLAKRLAAIDVGGAEWGEAAQLRALRFFVEEAIDKLEANEADYYEFMAQCAILASENMQDARLQVLEHRVGELENPPFDLAKTLFEGALILVGELIIAYGAYYALPALFGLAFTSRMARLRGDAVRLAESYGDDVARATQALDTDIAMGRSLLKQMQEAGYKDWGKAVNLKGRVKEIKRRIAESRDRLKTAELAQLVNEKTVKSVIDAYDRANGTSILKSAQLNELLRGVMASTVISRAGQTAGQDLATVSFSLLADSGPAFVPFETSGVVGQLLAAVRAERRARREQWNVLRGKIRFLEDTSLAASTLVRDVLGIEGVSSYESIDISTIPSHEQSIFILGFESLLWRHWFAYSNLLKVSPFEDRDPEGIHHEGEVFDGNLVEEHYADDAPDGYGYFMNGNHYHGAISINEELAKVLYNKFARGYFIHNPASVPAPMRALDENGNFDADRYDGLWRMPKKEYVVFDNAERTRRLDEVRVLIIVYFMRTAKVEDIGAGIGGADEIRKAIREMLDLPPDQPFDQGPLKEILEGLPTFETPGAPAVSQAQPGVLETLASALASTGALEQKWLVQDARSQLETAVGSLDMKVTTYPLLHASSAIALSADRAVAEDAMREIEQAQRQVSERHAIFVELAAEEPDVASEVDAQLGDRIRTLMTWSPGQIAEGTWKYYPPSASPPVS